ncbi:MAG: hypothetical protein AAB091_00890 [Elusimicrobiota bacterium]
MYKHKTALPAREGDEFCFGNFFVKPNEGKAKEAKGATKTKKAGRKILIASLASLAVMASLAFSAERNSSSFMDTRNGLGIGGGRKTSSSFQEDSIIGPVAVTTATSSSFHHRSGLLSVYYYPGTIANLSASTGPYAGSVRIAWSAPGADGNVSTPSAYVVKWDTNPFTTQSAFNSATTYVQTWGPLAPGGSESRTLTGLPRNSTAYIRIEAQDADKNQGYLSVQASSTTPATVVSVTVSPGAYNFGSMFTNTSSVTANSIVVTNDGNVYETYSMKATTATAGTLWKLGSNVSTNADEANLRAAFHGSRPAAGNFDANDDLAYANKTSNAAETFTIGASSTGYNANVNEGRDLWINLNMPLMTSTTDQQDFTLTITAAEEPQ